MEGRKDSDNPPAPPGMAMSNLKHQGMHQFGNVTVHQYQRTSDVVLPEADQRLPSIPSVTPPNKKRQASSTLLHLLRQKGAQKQNDESTALTGGYLL